MNSTCQGSSIVSSSSSKIWILSIKIMRGPSDLNNKKQLKDIKQIINYEQQILHLPTPKAKPILKQTQKYVAWALEQKIEQIVGTLPHSVRWIGNANTAHLQAYAYIMLIGSGHTHQHFLEFKQMIYGLGRKYLSMVEQKLLVQFLCMIEYAQDKYSFLSQYSQIEGVFIKILQKLEEEQRPTKISQHNPTFINQKAKGERRFTLPGNPLTVKRQLYAEKDIQSPETCLSKDISKNEMEHIYKGFNSYFKFINTLGSNEFCCTLQLFNSQKIHIVVEKNCYFVVELTHATRQHETLAKQAMSQLEEIMNNQDNQIQQHPTTNQKVEFDRNQFNQIFNFQRKVVESSVRPIQRGEQIKTLANSTQQKQKSSSKFQTFLEKKDSLKLLQTNQDIGILQNEHSFIDDLLIGHAEVPIFVTPFQNAKKQKEPAKTARIQQSMKGIMSIKEELKKVRSKIEDNIRRLDEQPLQKTRTTNIAFMENKTSVKHVFRALNREKRSNSLSAKVPHFLKNGNSITERPQDYKLKSHIPNQDKDRVKSMLVNSPSSSNVQQVEEVDEERDTISNLSPPSNHKYPQMNHSPTNFNLSVNVSINENTNGTPKMLSQHSSYPLTPIIHGQKISRYPSQFFNPNQFGAKTYPIKQIQYITAFPKPRLQHETNPEGSFLSKLKKITSPCKK